MYTAPKNLENHGNEKNLGKCITKYVKFRSLQYNIFHKMPPGKLSGPYTYISVWKSMQVVTGWVCSRVVTRFFTLTWYQVVVRLFVSSIF
jgi:hypothetical protein